MRWWPTTTVSCIVPKKLAVETAAKAQKRHDDEDGKRKRLPSRRTQPRHVQYARGAGEGRIALRRQAGGRVSGPFYQGLKLILLKLRRESSPYHIEWGGLPRS